MKTTSTSKTSNNAFSHSQFEVAVNNLVDAVKSVNMPFDKIDRNSFTQYFKSCSIPSNYWDDIYKEVSRIVKGGSSNNVVNSTQAPKSTIDYSVSSKINEVKQRTPRKSIFSEIKKIS